MISGRDWVKKKFHHNHNMVLVLLPYLPVNKAWNFIKTFTIATMPL